MTERGGVLADASNWASRMFGLFLSISAACSKAGAMSLQCLHQGA